MTGAPSPLAVFHTGRGRLVIHDQDSFGRLLAKLLPTAAAPALAVDPCAELEKAYLCMEGVLGLSVARAGPAAALLRELGFPALGKRFSKLTQRRRGAAHLDVGFNRDLFLALDGLEGGFVDRVVKRFHDKAQRLRAEELHPRRILQEDQEVSKANVCGELQSDVSGCTAGPATFDSLDDLGFSPCEAESETGCPATIARAKATRWR